MVAIIWPTDGWALQTDPMYTESLSPINVSTANNEYIIELPQNKIVLFCHGLQGRIWDLWKGGSYV